MQNCGGGSGRIPATEMGPVERWRVHTHYVPESHAYQAELPHPREDQGQKS